MDDWQHEFPPPESDQATELLRASRPRLVWDAGRALLLYLIVTLSTLVFGTAAFAYSGLYAMILVTQVFCFFGLPFLSTRIFDAGHRVWMRLPHSPKFRIVDWCVVIIGTIGWALLMTNLTVLTDHLIPAPPEQILDYYERFAANSVPEFILLVFLVVMLPGFCEEFAFRGVIQDGFEQTYGPAAAIVATGFLFGLAHLDPWHFAGLWGLGIALGWLVLRTGSIWPAAIAHAINNGGALVVATWFISPFQLEQPTFIDPWLNGLSLAIVVFAVWHIRRITRDQNHIPDHEVTIQQQL